jgi:hypothetical protein
MRWRRIELFICWRGSHQLKDMIARNLLNSLIQAAIGSGRERNSAAEPLDAALLGRNSCFS